MLVSYLFAKPAIKPLIYVLNAKRAITQVLMAHRVLSVMYPVASYAFLIIFATNASLDFPQLLEEHAYLVMWLTVWPALLMIIVEPVCPHTQLQTENVLAVTFQIVKPVCKPICVLLVIVDIILSLQVNACLVQWVIANHVLRMECAVLVTKDILITLSVNARYAILVSVQHVKQIMFVLFVIRVILYHKVEMLAMIVMLRIVFSVKIM